MARAPTTSSRGPAAQLSPKRMSNRTAKVVRTTAPAAITSPRSEFGVSRSSMSSDPRVHRRLLAGVVVEALAGPLAVPARGEHLAQRRRLGEAPLAELVPHHVADGAERVQPDEVRERQRAHRV